MTLTAHSTDGVEVAIHNLGGDGPPLLFVHATGFHGRCYQRIADQLAGHRHCWAPDLRGHGDTNAPVNGRFAWAGMADDLCAALDTLGIDEPIDFAGHSMGGATIAAVEVRRPGTIRSAWLFEPILFPAMEGDGRPPSGLEDIARKRRPGFDSFDDAIARYGARPPLSIFDPDVLDDYVRHGFQPTDAGVTLKCRPEDEASTFAGVDTSVFEQLSSLDADITIIGSGDGGPPASFAPMIAEQIPNAYFELWADSTHFGPFSDPDRTAAAIEATIR